MAHFTHFAATLRCLRCGSDSESNIQTYLLKERDFNWAQDYRVGDTEGIDGLDEFEPLHPWNGQTPLVLGVGDWYCKQCHLSWQWAKVTVSISETSTGLIGSIKSIETLVPTKISDFEGVHLIEPDLAGLSGLTAAAWNALSIAQRCSAIAAGFRNWCIEVAHVDPSAIES
jgi:hypothetical protein